MSVPLGEALPRRRGFVTAMRVCGVVFTFAVISAVRASDSLAGYAMCAAMALLLVVLPLGAAAMLSRLRIHVSTEHVASALGDRLGQTITWAEANVVHVRWQPGVGVMPRKRTVAIFTPREAGGSRRILVSEQLFDLGPLLAEVAAQVAHRPELLTTDEDREGLAEFTAEYGLR